MILRLLILLLLMAVSPARCQVPQFDRPQRSTAYPIIGVTDVTNILDFGADPTGTQDSFVAIQNALDYAKAKRSRSTVFAPAGTYKVGATVDVYDVNLEGSGSIQTTFQASSTFSGTTVFTVHDTIQNGAIRQVLLSNFAVKCGTGAPAVGVAPSTFDGITLTSPTKLYNTRVQYCNKGYVTNAAQGHQTFARAEANANYYGLYTNAFSQHHDGGNLFVYDSSFVGNSYSAVGVPADGYISDAHFLRTDFGFSPYSFWQEGGALTGYGFLTGIIFDDCGFEGTGNVAIQSKSNGIGSAGLLNNLVFNFAGYSSSVTDVNLNLPATSCVSGSSTGNDGSPYQCCTGSGTGCRKDYAVIGAVCYEWTVLGGLHQFATPSGGSGAVLCGNCLGKLEFNQEVATTMTITCSGHPEYVRIQDVNGLWSTVGLTPKTTAPTCVSAVKGNFYYDSNLGWACFCNGSAWCWAHSPTTCSSSSSCGTTSTSTSTTTSSTSTSTTST